MRKLFILVVLAVGALLLYKLWAEDDPQSKTRKRASPENVVKDLVGSGKKVGRKTSDAFDSLNH